MNMNIDLPQTTEKLVEPINKLIDAVSGAIGKLYEPTHVKRMACAKAEEIKLMADAIRDNIDVPTLYKSGDVTIDSQNYEDLIKRTSTRLAFQEIRKQQNMDAVVDKTCCLLKNSEKVSSEPIDQDWITRFINSIEDISNEEMQDIWAKILAGEIKRPKTFSLRTLETIKNLTVDEAKAFQDLSQYFLTNGNEYFLPNEQYLLDKYSIGYQTILLLDECGLMSSNPFLQIEAEFNAREESSLYNSQVIIFLKNNGKNEQTHSQYIYGLQSVGKQLFQIIKKHPNADFVKDFAMYLRDAYKDFSITAHNINFITNDGYVDYQEQDLLPAEKEN